MQYLTEKYGISNHLSNPDKIASLRDLGIEEDVPETNCRFSRTLCPGEIYATRIFGYKPGG
jgi:hypothetical protein